MPRWPVDKTTALKKAFIAALRDEFTVGVAADLAHIHRGTAYKWRNADPAFAAEWDEAQEHALDTLAGSMFRRAKDDDTVAAIFMLKSHRRDTYGDRIDVRLTVKQQAERLATDLGLPLDEVMSELDEILAGAR